MKNALKFSQPVVLGRFTSDPAGAVAGAIYFNTSTNKFKSYDGSTWADLATGAVSTEFLTTVFRLLDSTDSTKKIAFNASSISASTTRTVTMPDYDVNLGDIAGKANASDVVLRDGSQTLTGALLPNATGTIDLGSSSARYNKLFSNELEVMQGYGAVGITNFDSLFSTSLFSATGGMAGSIYGTAASPAGIALYSSTHNIAIAAATSVNVLAASGDVILDGNNINVSSKKIINVQDGTNPTDGINLGQLDAAIAGIDLSGYIPTTQKGAPNGVATLDSNSLVPITQIPPAALERLVVVADQTARYALTTATVQNGDTVKQTDTGEMFFVKDDTQLNNAAGYAVYTAGTASSVAWSGVTGTPTTLAGYGISDGANTTLSNLAITSINSDLVADADNSRTLGKIGVGWSDLYLNGAIKDNSGTSIISGFGGAPELDITKPIDMNGQQISGALYVQARELHVSDSTTGSIDVTVTKADKILLTDGVTDTVIAAFTQPTNSTMDIKYKLTNMSTGAVRQGILLVASDINNNSSIADQGTETGDVDVTFSAVVSGGNIEVHYDSVANGSAGYELRYSVTIM